MCVSWILRGSLPGGGGLRITHQCCWRQSHSHQIPIYQGIVIRYQYIKASAESQTPVMPFLNFSFAFQDKIRIWICGVSHRQRWYSNSSDWDTNDLALGSHIHSRCSLKISLQISAALDTDDISGHHSCNISVVEDNTGTVRCIRASAVSWDTLMQRRKYP